VARRLPRPTQVGRADVTGRDFPVNAVVIPSLRILAVEDVATDIVRAERELTRAGLTFEIDRVDTEPAFRRGLEPPPDLIMSDFSLPRFDGLSALRIAQAEAPDIPFIFVSGTLGEERAIEALRMGATDYVLKSNLSRLGPVVIRALQENRDRRAAKRAEQRFRDLVQTSPDWIWELDVDGRYVYSSPGVGDILGFEADKMLGAHHSDYVHPQDRALIEGALRSLGAQGRTLLRHTARFRHCDGSYRWLERHSLAVVDDHGCIIGFRGTDRDITVRKQQAERIGRLNRVHAMLSSINTAVLRVRDRRELLKEVCRIASTQGGYPAAAVILADAGIARTVAVEGTRASCYQNFSFTVRPNPTSFASLTEEALLTGRPVVCNDLNDPTKNIYGRAEAIQDGLCACSVWPLIVDGTVIGTLNLDSAEVDAFDEEELALLGQVAGSLSFALQYIEKEGAAEFLAYFDPMTGLARRGLFCERLARTLSSETASVAPLSLLVLDVERLSALNDRYGRHGGDRLLQLIAERLKVYSPDSTRLAYFGSGCFGIVVVDTDGPGRSMDAAPASLSHLFDRPLSVDAQDVKIAVRIGAARYPDDSTTADELLQNAEMAAKSAKESGDRYLRFATRMNTDVQRRMTLEQQLVRALEERQFVLYYQPKVSLATGTIVGAEGLLRWSDPEKGLRSPADFIPVLESSGLIVDVGQWVIAQAVADTLAWHEADLPMVPFAVNVSTRQLKGRDFVESVLGAIAPLRAIRRGIDIEITESALMEDLDASADKLKALKAAGIGIAIDDFGTGHSSLGRLARLAVDSLKIDRSFIAGLDAAPSNQTIVSTIISLAQSFKLAVIAEGVETRKELAVLRRLKCTQFQGYLAGKPMPLGALLSLVTESGGVLQHVAPLASV
jgi:PAS domain S-box-containing protein/diguanylate cyclase (GGDEF)-like protein